MAKPNRGHLLHLSQNATNEIWSTVLRNKHPTPGAQKRAVEHVVRASMEALTGMKSTVDGSETGFNFLGGKCDKILPNPNEDQAALRAVVLSLHSCLNACAGDTVDKQLLSKSVREGVSALKHPQVKEMVVLLEKEGLL